MSLEHKLAWSIPDFAELHGISESKVWDELSNNELESMSVGDRRLITPEQRARWIERKAERARQRDAARVKARREIPSPGNDEPPKAA